jgi:hypothetical protein
MDRHGLPRYAQEKLGVNAQPLVEDPRDVKPV